MFTLNKLILVLFITTFTSLSLASESFILSLNQKDYLGKSIGLTYCKYVVKKGDSIGKLIRLFGFSKPFKAGQLILAKQKNKQITDINKIQPKDEVLLPILYHKEKFNNLNNGLPCELLQSWHQVQPYIIKGNEEINSTRILSSTSENQKLPDPSEIKKSYIFHHLEIKFGGVYDSLHELNTSNISLVSELQPYININIIQVWSKHWESFFGSSYIAKNYKDTKNKDNNIKNNKLNLFNFHLGLNYIWNESSYLKSTLGINESTYYQVQGQNLNVDKFKYLFLDLSLSQQIMSLQNLNISVLGALIISQPVDVEIDNIVILGGGLGLDYKLNNSSIVGLEAIYKQTDLKININKIEHRRLDLLLKYRYKF